jgi:hypothetical protein
MGSFLKGCYAETMCLGNTLAGTLAKLEFLPKKLKSLKNPFKKFTSGGIVKWYRFYLGTNGL